MTNKFDIVMDYIDAHVHEDPETIKKGIYNEIGYNSNHFGKCFEVLTGDTLFHYISERKLFFAGQELKHSLNPICDIALNLGYSEQSAFTRVMKTYHNCTPNEIRKGIKTIPNKKYQLSDFHGTKYDSIEKNFISDLETYGIATGKRYDRMMTLQEAAQEYGFSIDNCYAIADVAERLEIPAGTLIENCFQLMIEVQKDPDYFSPEVEAVIDCGVESSDEMERICDYFQCKYYDVDSFMVEAYRNRDKE